MNNRESKKLRSRFMDALFKSRIDRQNRVEMNTALNFLLAVNGLKRGMVSVILGTTSSGKSTFMRSIVADILMRNSKARISCYLSEETKAEYKTELFKAFKSGGFTSRMEFYSEQDCESEEDMLKRLNHAFADKSDVLILDNITTSSLYNSATPQEQSKFSNYIKTKAKKTAKILIVVAHTNNVDKSAGKLINSSDIRGSKNLSNISEFFFINHQITRGDNLFNYVQIEKHRGQGPDSRLFQLKFDRERNLYTGDFSVTFDDFKDMYKQRNKI